MPTAEALLRAARLRLGHVDAPQLDARLLLQHAAGVTHEQLVADPQMEIGDDVAVQFEVLVDRRVNSEPVSRIIGTRNFYGRDFSVTPAVLDPRGDTEVLIEACLSRMPEGMAQGILDLGTGSGIIAVTLLAERPLATGVAVDTSQSALEVAHSNAHMHGVEARLSFEESDWFGAITRSFDIITSNPPYIEAADIAFLARDVKDFDPRLALDGGDDGLICYRAIARGVQQHLADNGRVIVEIGAGQRDDVTMIFAESSLVLEECLRDLAGHDRCLVFRRP
jgi:release factor glutamine methyltransferase